MPAAAGLSLIGFLDIVRLLHFFIALACLLGSAFSHAATLAFNGGSVSGCTQGADVTQYTCAALVLADTDVVVIASGYGVTVNSSLTMKYNQGLTMSGSAALTVKGNLDIKDINPPNLKVTGGKLTAEGGTFSMGAQAQTVTATIAATTIKMGSNAVRVTGSITGKGLVEIASGSTINGPISGATVNILAASTRIQGDITATTSLTIGSGSQVTGNLTAPVIDLQASGLLVTGDVKASNTLTIASGNGIKGNVEGGNVTLDASNAYITGNARVDHITLGWQGRVQQTITCKAYTPANPCSCVTNNSGWPENSENGPKCGNSTLPALHHFQIEHPLTALTCQVPTVTVSACADASCSTLYKNGASVTVSPGGVPTQIDTSGINPDVTVRQTTPGVATLSLVSTPATTGALVCKSGGSISNCQINFVSSGFQVSGVPRYAEEDGALLISAVQAGASNPAVCVPMFAGQSKELNLSCGYSNPGQGTLPARIFDSGKNSYVPLAGNDQSSCSALGANVTVAFGADGVARPNMRYADAGALRLTATYKPTSGSDSGLTMTGSGTLIVAPKKFQFTALAPTQRAGLAAAPLAAGAPILLSAVNAAGAVTKNFGNESAVPKVVLGTILLSPGYTGALNPAVGGTLDFLKKGGVTEVPPLIWPEVGKINFTAALDTGYLGSSLTSAGASDAVLFYPHHFVTELVIATTDGKEFPFPCSAPLSCAGNRAVYSRQPFGLTIRSRTSGGQDTKNFDARNEDINKTQLSLLPYDAATGKTSYPPKLPAGSTLTDDATVPATVTNVPVSSFSNGVATRPIAYRFPAAYPKAGADLASPTGVLLRATYDFPGGANVTSAPSDGTEAQLTVFTGRRMVPHDYGSERYPVRLAVQVQYWDGSAWVANLADSISAFSKAQVLLANCKQALVCDPKMVADGTYTVDKGVLPPNKRLVLLAPGAGQVGSVDVSVPGFVHLPSTVGTVVFGVFKSGPVIYLREMY